MAQPGLATIGCLIAGPGVAVFKAGHWLIIVSRIVGTGRLLGAVGR